MTGDSPIVFLNGEYLPVADAKVSVLDRGFLFGDGVYEVVPVFGDSPFRLDEHLRRLGDSLAAIDIPNPCDDGSWRETCREVMRRNPSAGDRSLYIQVTRGAGERRDHLYPEGLVPTVLVMCRPVSLRSQENGVSAVTLPDIRWQHCHIKAVTLLANVMLRQAARKADGSYEAILVREGKVTEGAASNVFIVKDEAIATPPKDGSILPGITRDLLVELLRGRDLDCRERPIGEDELKTADEIWLTGSMTGVAPVIRLNGEPVSGGKPGPAWRRANGCFLEYIEEYKRGGGSAAGRV